MENIKVLASSLGYTPFGDGAFPIGRGAYRTVDLLSVLPTLTL